MVFPLNLRNDPKNQNKNRTRMYNTLIIIGGCNPPASAIGIKFVSQHSVKRMLRFAFLGIVSSSYRKIILHYFFDTS